MLLYNPECYGKSFSISFNLGKLPKFRFFGDFEKFKKEFNKDDSLLAKILKDIFATANHSVDDLLDGAEKTSLWNNLVSWKKKIVKNPSILTEHCSSHLFSVAEDDSYCLLYRDKKRPERVSDCERID